MEDPRREGFPDLPENLDDVRQCNEPGSKFLLDDSEDNKSVVLDVQVGKYMARRREIRGETRMYHATLHPHTWAYVAPP